MTIKNRDARTAYENAPADLRAVVDRMYDAMRSEYVNQHYGVSGLQRELDGTDAAENLVTDIFLYVCESNKIAWRGFVY